MIQVIDNPSSTGYRLQSSLASLPSPPAWHHHHLLSSSCKVHILVLRRVHIYKTYAPQNIDHKMCYLIEEVEKSRKTTPVYSVCCKVNDKQLPLYRPVSGTLMRNHSADFKSAVSHKSPSHLSNGHVGLSCKILVGTNFRGKRRDHVTTNFMWS